MSRTEFQLPQRKEIRERLNQLDDNSEFNSDFYPLLEKHAAKDYCPIDVVIHIQLAIFGHMQGVPEEKKRRVGALLHCSVPSFIDALVLDKNVANQVKALWKDINEQAAKAGDALRS
jgi:hypothetical protein